MARMEHESYPVAKCPCGAGQVIVDMWSDMHMYAGPPRVEVSCSCGRCAQNYSFSKGSQAHAFPHAFRRTELAARDAWSSRVGSIEHRIRQTVHPEVARRLGGAATASGRTKKAWSTGIEQFLSTLGLTVSVEIPRHRSLADYCDELARRHAEYIAQKLLRTDSLFVENERLRGELAAALSAAPSVEVLRLPEP